MPELPEVEIIKRGLNSVLVSKRIRAIEIEPSFSKKILPNTEKFVSSLEGETIKKVSRRSKLLIFELKSGEKIVVHLKMTGQLVYKPKNNQIIAGGHPIASPQNLPNKFTRVTFSFNDGTKLFFNDVRKFGFMKLVDAKGLSDETQKYGYEPIDKKFTLAHFKGLLARSPRKKIKSFLLEQNLIAGLGNIYADESLFMAQLLPTRLVQSLTKKDQEALYQAIVDVIKKAIKHKGTTFHDYVNVSGHKGNFQKHLQVYGRQKKKCVRCKKGIITKIKLGSRSASFCPVCQK